MDYITIGQEGKETVRRTGTSQEEQIPVHQKFTILWHTGSQILDKTTKNKTGASR